MIKINKIKPMFTAIVTTMEKYENDQYNNGLLTKSKGTLKEYQRVIAVGSTVRDINVGDMIWINPSRFALKKHKEGTLKDGIVTDNPTVEYNFDVIQLDGVKHLLLQDRDVEFIIEDYEEIEDTTPPSQIIQAPGLIV